MDWLKREIAVSLQSKEGKPRYESLELDISQTLSKAFKMSRTTWESSKPLKGEDQICQILTDCHQ